MVPVGTRCMVQPTELSQPDNQPTKLMMMMMMMNGGSSASSSFAKKEEKSERESTMDREW